MNLLRWNGFICAMTLVAFLCTGVVSGFTQGVTGLPNPGVMVPLSQQFQPPVLKGVKVYADNPFRFDFILDKGVTRNASRSTQEDSLRLIKYFLAALTVPDQDLWVNLSPYEKDRIVPEAFGRTEMGRDLLAQDYILKQITATVIYPEGEVGKQFWSRIYTEAAKRFGTTDIPVDTFNKVWIVPEKAVVYENAKAGAVCIVESRLKVMLESDYLAESKTSAVSGQQASEAKVSVDQKGSSELSKQLLREIVIPILEKEVNEGANFAPLRQLYHSLILAAWYKRKIKASILGQAYVDHKKTAGIDIVDQNEKERIWQKYVEAFRKGAYNLVKEEVDPATREAIPRKYFSGGAFLAPTGELLVSRNALTESLPPDLKQEFAGTDLLTVDLAMNSVPAKPATATQYPTTSQLNGQFDPQGMDVNFNYVLISSRRGDAHLRYPRRGKSGDQIKITFECVRPPSLHWGVNGWQKPPDEMLQSMGLQANEDGTVDFPQKPSWLTGKYEFVFPNLPENVREINFIVKMNGQEFRSQGWDQGGAMSIPIFDVRRDGPDTVNLTADEKAEVLRGTAAYLQTELKRIYHIDMGIEPAIDTDTSNMAYPSGPLVASLGLLDGYVTAMYWGQPDRSGEQFQVNFIMVHPFEALGFGKSSPDALYATSAVYINKQGKIGMAQFREPVRIDALVNPGDQVTDSLSQLESKGVPLAVQSSITGLAGDKVATTRFLHGRGFAVPQEISLKSDVSADLARSEVLRFIESFGTADIVVKPSSGSEGDGVKMFPGNNKEAIVQYVQSMLKSGAVVVQKREEPEEWRNPRTGRLYDYNFRVLSTLDPEGRKVVVDPDMIEVRFKERDYGPVNHAKGAGVMSLREFFRQRGFDPARQETYLRELIPPVVRAAESLAGQSGVVQGAGLLGWDIIKTSGGDVILEVNTGNVGGIRTLERLRNEASEGQTIKPFMRYWTGLARRYAESVVAGRLDQIAEFMRMPQDVKLLNNSIVPLMDYPIISEHICYYLWRHFQLDHRVLTRYINVLRRQNKNKQALMVFNQAISAGMYYTDLLLEGSTLLYSLGKSDELEPILQEAINNRQMSDQGLFMYLLKIMYASQKYAEIIPVLQKVRERAVSLPMGFRTSFVPPAEESGQSLLSMDEFVERGVERMQELARVNERRLQRQYHYDDAAQSVGKDTGGVDLTSGESRLDERNAGGEAIRLNFDPAMLAQVKKAAGFTPVIVNIQPMSSLQMFLGLQVAGSTGTAG
ncbi:MAG: hypothetical protein HGA80_05325 [Candidatus Omnitrophica bacterium]|nr:hypothetical protein [Candidatus Omnitrophota bacterium]